ncbi:hypothetical protein [Prosthecobacter sp.]|uniref:hypothetical protein n=1 Tax=Prosthecobacter sp. TaxID=1965333 RepID=UPI0037850671
MPPILDVAIGTFFVFMLFSIVVTALNELVLTFFDKRADFLRLGLGELLSDPQKDVVNGYLSKALKYGSSQWQWFVAWVAGTWAGLSYFHVKETYVTYGPIIVAAALIMYALFMKFAPEWLRRKGMVCSSWHGVQWLGKRAFVRARLAWLKGQYEKAVETAHAAAEASDHARTAADNPPADKNEMEIKNLQQAAKDAEKAAMSAAASADEIWTEMEKGRAVLDAMKSGPPQTDGSTITVEDVFQHPLIFSLSKGDSDPSYIRSSAFAKAVLDLLSPAVDTRRGADSAPRTGPPTRAELEEAIQNLGNEKLKKSLAALLRTAEGDVEKFKTSMEDWFNHSMERVTGWYKRHAQTWLLSLGFILAMLCNVDALRIIDSLSKNPNLAKAVAAQAESYSKTKKAPPTAEEQAHARELKEQKIAEATASLNAVKDAMSPEKLEADLRAAADDAAKQKRQDAFNEASDPQKLKDAQQELDNAINWDGTLADFKADLKALRDTGIPMGWEKKRLDEFGFFTSRTAEKNWRNLQWDLSKWSWSVLFPALCGWGIMALAASLGAPFWFDLLQRVMNLRANGRAPDEKALGTKKDADTATPEKPNPKEQPRGDAQPGAQAGLQGNAASRPQAATVHA